MLRRGLSFVFQREREGLSLLSLRRGGVSEKTQNTRRYVGSTEKERARTDPDLAINHR